MSRRLIVRSEAEEVILKASREFDRLRDGLGSEFWECAKAELAFIERWPLASAPYYKDHRRRVMRRFQYEIFYRVEGDLISVDILFHPGADPNRIKRSLKDS